MNEELVALRSLLDSSSCYSSLLVLLVGAGENYSPTTKWKVLFNFILAGGIIRFELMRTILSFAVAKNCSALSSTAPGLWFNEESFSNKLSSASFPSFMLLVFPCRKTSINISCDIWGGVEGHHQFQDPTTSPQSCPATVSTALQLSGRCYCHSRRTPPNYSPLLLNMSIWINAPRKWSDGGVLKCCFCLKNKAKYVGNSKATE